jgi:hypothetical protein
LLIEIIPDRLVPGENLRIDGEASAWIARRKTFLTVHELRHSFAGLFLDRLVRRAPTRSAARGGSQLLGLSP